MTHVTRAQLTSPTCVTAAYSKNLTWWTAFHNSYSGPNREILFYVQILDNITQRLATLHPIPGYASMITVHKVTFCTRQFPLHATQPSFAQAKNTHSWIYTTGCIDRININTHLKHVCTWTQQCMNTSTTLSGWYLRCYSRLQNSNILRHLKYAQKIPAPVYGGMSTSACPRWLLHGCS